MYCSTRGQVFDVGFEQVLFSGYPDDGGLFVPKVIPRLSYDVIDSWKRFSYRELVQCILPLFISEAEIPRNDLHELLNKSYLNFESEDVITIANLKDKLHILELFHGPTMTFKDLGLQVVAQFLNYFLTKSGRRCLILVGTSGDTGSSAIQAVRDMPNVDIVVILPKYRCTEFQERQMTTVHADNVHVYRADGSSDELDQPIKRCFADIDYASKHRLMSINSINWARIMLQIVHFFYGYFKATSENSEPVQFVIPTGGCGNLVAGCIAQKMGLPITFISAVNSNDVISRLFTTSRYTAKGPIIRTYAPAMDIQMAYNLERIFWLFSDGDCNLVRKTFEYFEQNLDVAFPDHILNRMKSIIDCHKADDNEIKEAINRCWKENNYILCPHTATAVHYHYSRKAKSLAHMCLATAAPVKFEEAVKAAGVPVEQSAVVDKLYSLPTKFTDWNSDEDWDASLRQAIENISNRY